MNWRDRIALALLWLATRISPTVRASLNEGAVLVLRKAREES